MLKVGLALSSIVFAIVSFTRASDILSYYPNFIISIFGDLLTLAFGAIISIFLAVWVLARKHKFASAFTYMLVIGLGMLANITSLTFLAVAWPLFCIAGALSLRYYPRIRVIIPGKNGQEKMKIVPIITIDEVEDEGDGEETKTDIQERTSSKAEPAAVYGKEVPFTEHLPHSDEDHHYSPLSTLPSLYSNRLDQDGEHDTENPTATFAPEKNEYESTQFAVERDESNRPELIMSLENQNSDDLASIASAAIENNAADKPEYIISPFSPDHIKAAAEKAANDLRSLKPKRTSKARATTISIDELPHSKVVSDITTEIKHIASKVKSRVRKTAIKAPLKTKTSKTSEISASAKKPARIRKSQKNHKADHVAE